MKRWVLFVVMLLLAAGAGVWWWLTASSAAGQPLTLSDGSIITFRAVTFGTNHTYYGGGTGQRLARLVPAKWRPRLGLRGPNMRTGQPTLVVWTTTRRPPNRTIYPRYVIGGEAGFSPASPAASMTSGAPDGGTVEGTAFAAFPRRGSTITLRVYEPGPNWPDMKFVGEFTMRNPEQRHDPPWQPEPLPASRTNDEFAVTLKELLVGVSTSDLQKPKPPPNEPEAGARAVFHFTRDDRPTKEWEPASFVMTDATGNRTGSTSWSGSWRDGDYVAGFKPFLWTDERAWNLKFEFTRRTNFAPDELWVVRNVPVGIADLTNNPAFGTNLQGASIQIENVRSRDDYGSDKTRKTWTVRLRVKPAREDYRLTLAGAMDEQGRDATSYGSSWGGGEHTFDLGVKTNATHLSLTLALHRSRYEEFRVEPMRFQGATNAHGTADAAR